MLTFDAEHHLYFFDGHPVPGVTTLLKPLYDFQFVKEEVMEEASARGTAVHRACELYDADDLDEASLDPMLRPYLDAWVKFRHETGFVPRLNEKQVFHPLLRYAGTLDKEGDLGSAPTVIDIKSTASLSPVIGIQLAAYVEALKAAPKYAGPKKLARAAVQLKSDGNYKLKHYTDSTDLSAFVGLVNVFHWCDKHNINQGDPK